MINPYSAPSIESAANDGYRLYSPGHVAWATFLGSPLAGSLLLAWNFKRLGNSAAGTVSFVAGFLAMILLMGTAYLLPEDFPDFVLPAGLTFGMYELTKALQGDRYKLHLAQGGNKASGWAATGVGLLCLIFILMVLFGTALVLPETWVTDEPPPETWLPEESPTE